MPELPPFSSGPTEPDAARTWKLALVSTAAFMFIAALLFALLR
jgi:hypothetical protein